MPEVLTRRERLITDAGGDRLSWGGILGGTVAAIAVWLLLYSFGLALGLSTIDPNDPGSVRGSGLFTGIWGAVAPLAALFVGGLVASRGSPIVTRGQGALHGLVVWSLATVVGVWLLTSLATSVLSGVARVGETAAMATGGSAVAEAVGIGEGERVDPQAALEPSPTAEGTALQAADTTGAVFWGVFGALLLGMVSAILGGAVGVSRRDYTRVATTEETTTGPAVGVEGHGAHPAMT